MNRNISSHVWLGRMGNSASRCVRWVLLSLLAVCGSVGAQQYMPPISGPIAAGKAAEPQLVVTLPEEAVFRGTQLDAKTRAEIIKNLHEAGERDLSVIQIDRDIAAQRVINGQVMMPILAPPAPMMVPGPALPSEPTSMPDPCALPDGVAPDALPALERLLRQTIEQLDLEEIKVADFEKYLPKDCPLKMLEYYANSAMLVAPTP